MDEHIINISITIFMRLTLKKLIFHRTYRGIAGVV